ncbi:peroxisomal membrane protein pex14 [Ascosphaera atra]|nr:peroxisomal membrane protein pex14 [Ascosphaera atra]
MAPREELVASALILIGRAVLQDPSVASAPLEKKIAFMQSKNLTQEEIDVSLARAAGASTAMVPAPQMNQAQAGAGYRPPLPAGAPGYGGPWAQQQLPPPEYITPLIAPPTPPQLQQDKEDIDEQFNKAFALIDQLTSDTASLKEAEETRSEKLDSALREVESVTSDLRSSSRRRDDDLRRISEEIRNLKDAIPKAIEGERKGHERRLTELGTELKSLKQQVELCCCRRSRLSCRPAHSVCVCISCSVKRHRFRSGC